MGSASRLEGSRVGSLVTTFIVKCGALPVSASARMALDLSSVESVSRSIADGTVLSSCIVFDKVI